MNKSPEQTKKEYDHIIWLQKPWWVKLAFMFSMQKSDIDKVAEEYAEQEWKDSGVKSWKELLNID